jgi:hypothetical protein
MNGIAKWAVATAMIAASGVVSAQIETYDFTVTPAGGPAGVATGAFSYDCSSLGTLCATGGTVAGAGLLSHLSFTFNGINYDESTASTGALTLNSGGGLASVLFGNDCPGGFCFLVQSTNDWLADISTTNPTNAFQYVTPDGGGWLGTVEVEKVTMSAPEIDAASSVAALTLLAGVILILGDRRSRGVALRSSAHT